MIGINRINISSGLLSQCCEIEEFKGLWIGLERHTTGLGLIGDVAEHADELRPLLSALAQQKITPDIIAALHAQHSGEKSPSAFRTLAFDLEIRAQDQPVGILQTADAQDIAPLLEKLCDWVEEALAQKSLHPLLVIGVFTSVFLQISPFDQHNMKLARFLVMLFMLKANYSYAPYVSLAVVMDERAQEVYEALKANQASLASGQPDWDSWLAVFLDVLSAQKDVLHERLYAKEAALGHVPELSTQIMDLFKEHKRLQMKEIIRLTGGRRATLKLRLAELVKAGFLKRHGQARATWYALH